MWWKLGTRFLIALSGVKLAGGVAVWLATLDLASDATVLPPWYHLTFLLLFFVAGLLLVLCSHRDERPALLGTVFVLFSSVFADPLLTRAATAGSGAVIATGGGLLAWQPAAFLPFVFWRLATRFPRTHDEIPTRARSSLFVWIAGLAGLTLFVATLAALLPWRW